MRFGPGSGSGIDNHGAFTICLHAGGNLASVKTGLGLLGGGCSVDPLNQKSRSLPGPSLPRLPQPAGSRPLALSIGAAAGAVMNLISSAAASTCDVPATMAVT